VETNIPKQLGATENTGLKMTDQTAELKNVVITERKADGVASSVAVSSVVLQS